MNSEADGHPDSWLIVQNALDRAQAGRDATLFALANGSVGVRGGIDELPGQHASFLPDAYVRRRIDYHERFPGFADHTDTRLSGPGLCAIQVRLDDVPVDFTTAQATAFKRVLDPRAGILDRSTRWQLADGRTLVIEAQRLTPLEHGALCCSRIAVRLVGFSARVTLAFPIPAADAGAGPIDPDDPRINARAALAGAGAWTRGDDHEALFTLGDKADQIRIRVVQRLHGDAGCVPNAQGYSLDAELTDGGRLTVRRYVALASERGGEPPATQALTRQLDEAQTLGFEALAARQQAACARFWRHAALSIAGDEALERAIRFNLFHLFQSASRSDRHSIAAKGLTGEGYEGHYFWDTDAFVLPVLALTQPALARHLIAWRCGRLANARAHARAIGHARGALFAWRTIGGDECSAHYPTGSAQYHVNAAVAFGMAVYEAASGDTAFIDEVCAETLVETARLWLDVGHFSARRGGAFVIHGVTGPDEYSALVDNDYYTNSMARRHLLLAARVADRLSLARRAALGLDNAEVASWRAAAQRMWLPVDAATGVSPQDDAFLDKPVMDFAGLPRSRFPLLLSYHPMQLFRHQLCKQGDVIQAHAMAGEEISAAQKARDLAYYEPLTTHDSTLSATAFSIAAADIGLEDKALAYLEETALVDLEDRHRNSSHGAHMAAMAGSWLALAQGWAGLQLDAPELRLRPRCPSSWRGYSLRLVWRGSLIELAVDPVGAHYRLIEGPALTLVDHGRAVLVDRDGMRVSRPAMEAVIFDLDGVLTDTAEQHYRAWRTLCDEEGLPFDRAFNEQLKGVDRAGSLRLILEATGRAVNAQQFAAMMERKNAMYQAAIAAVTPADLFPGVHDLLIACRRAGLKIGLASASRNAGQLIDRLGITRLFDHVVDAAHVTRGKPDPEVFLKAAAALGVAPGRCVGVEDASAGIAAIRAAGMTAIGIGSAQMLSGAVLVVPHTGALEVADLLEPAGKANSKNNSVQPVTTTSGSSS